MTREFFEQLYIQILPSLYRIAMSILHHQEDAMDAVQQAVEKAWSISERIHTGGERAYITRVVINECRNIQRFRRRNIPTSCFEDGEEKCSDSELYDAISELPEKYRLPLLMIYMEGYSMKEVAETINISESAVKSRLFRARKQLKSIILETE